MISPKQSIQDLRIENMEEENRSWRLKLNLNENIYGASSLAVNALKNIEKESLNLYSTSGKLTNKLAQKYHINEDNFIITNGAKEALSLIINAYLDINEELLAQNPVNPVLNKCIKIANGKLRTFDCKEKFIFDKDYFLQSIDEKTKIVYISTPNIITGELLRASFLKTLIANFSNILFVLDCSYVNFAQDVVLEDYIDLIKEFNNVAIIKSFSNDYGIAGLNIGFCISNFEIINNLKKVYFSNSVNVASLACAISALSDDKFIENIKEQNFEAKKLLTEILLENCYKPFESEGNFILCDFFDHCDFYYKKFKNNGVIVQKFDKNSCASTCLRITVPTIGGVKFIGELLKVKPLLIFDLDGTIFDVSESYIFAIKETFKYFTQREISDKEIYEIKNQGGMNCNWVAIKHLLAKNGYEIDIIDIISVFQEMLCNPNNPLIDKEKLLISKDIFDELNKTYDMVIFSGRLKEEALYSLKKFNLENYFSYFVTSDDLPKNMLKPHSRGVLEIIKHCPHNDIKFIGDSIDDIISGNSANIITIGVVAPNVDYNIMVNKFRHVGANHILSASFEIQNYLKKIDKKEDSQFG